MNPLDFRQTNIQIADDLDVFFDSDGEDIIDILLFRARIDYPEDVVLDGGVVDVVGSIEEGERALTYDDPVQSKAKVIPFETPFLSTFDGEDPLDTSNDTPIVMLIKAQDVPKYSVVQYQEFVSSTEVRRVSLCVMKSETFGRSPVIGTKHYMIPFIEDEGILGHE
jgi:hypothetical protein